ncbi:MAG: ATP synthase subunit I [Candidatus Competibacteraceae bacterium]
MFLAVLGGAALGLLYYAGLWFTLRRLPEQAYPALWVFGSFTLRLAAGMHGFYHPGDRPQFAASGRGVAGLYRGAGAVDLPVAPVAKPFRQPL